MTSKFAFLLLLLTISCTVKTDNQSTDLEQRIIGKWTGSGSATSQTYEFYSDGIWRWQNDLDDTLLVNRGRYTVSDDSAIYMRRFGVQHWKTPLEDTVEDFRTSIGAEVLFLNKNVLIDNQEDYEQLFKKQNTKN